MKKLVLASVVAIAAIGCTISAHAGTIEFSPTAAHPNETASPNSNAFGSDANVSVGYSAYTYAYPSGYSTLDSGSGAAIYSDTTNYTFAMTFTAGPGYTVTLNSFNLAQYTTSTDSVDITVTGGGTTYSLTDTPLGVSSYTTYSPNETGTLLTLTITNLYDVGLNTISYSETPTAVPEPLSMALLGTGLVGLGMARRRRNSR